MSDELMIKDEAASALLAFIFSGALGSTNGKGVVSYALIETTATTFFWSAALKDFDGPAVPVDRYLLADAILSATGQHLASWTRFTDGALSISYKVTVQEDADVAYVTVDPRILPVPPVYPIPVERSRQEATGIGRQIPRLIQGTVASAKLLDIGPDRHYNLGGPFSSVREYLQAYIKSSLVALEKQQDIEEYKEQYLERIRDFIKNRMHTNMIPSIVEDTPVVAIHSDKGPHNIIVSNHSPVNIQAVIDWEFVASAPFASQFRIIEILFRKSAANGFSPDYEGAAELCEIFWNAIPRWKKQVFLEWFRFGLFQKPEWRPKEHWRENIRVVEGILQKYA
ncbi:hypothetical protein B0H66DRAFT_572519 [Apodospora peruviana]|uniref:Aminoglycoside phosphotransferase domain-containing protein n=1 Tax=Apodospora peruviana TaxID=516989 RepID=A0AAE0MGU9_9PEZI|nr:hypothetical protein B0H66DRAFT_572519 [Apodospora peruviana]